MVMEQRILGRVASERAGEQSRLPVHAVLDNIRSAFNTGSMFRTADAAGIVHLHLCGMTAMPPNYKLLKTALGAVDYVPWTYYKRTSDALRVLRLRGMAIVAIETAPEAASLFDVDWQMPCAVVFGNEVGGISADVLSECDTVVSIPMTGFKNTINVATAFGIVTYELHRQLLAREPRL